MRTLKRKGGGFFKKLLNTLSGRKSITKKLMRNRKLSNEEEERKKQLKRKFFKTKKEKQELNILQAKIAPREAEFEGKREYQKTKRTSTQKMLNRFYPKKPKVPSANIDGFIVLQNNYRKPLLESNLAISNQTIPEPNDIIPRIKTNVNGNEVELRKEPQRSGVNRTFAFLYQKAFGVDPQIPYKVSETEFKQLQQKIFNAIGPGAPRNREDRMDKLEILAREVFHASSLDELDKELYNNEVGEKGMKDPTQSKIVETNDKYISDSYGKFLDRYLDFFFADSKRLQYVFDFDEYQCFVDDISFNNDGRISRQPLTTLKSNLCISIFNNLETIYSIGGSDGLRSNWMVLDPVYFPSLRPEITSRKADFTAKYFQETSFIQDALDNWGILAVDPLLWKLFQTKYPEIAIKMNTFLFTSYKDKLPLYFKELKYTDNFIVVDESIDIEKNTKDFFVQTFQNPFSSSSKYYNVIKNAAKYNKLYGVSPYLAYLMKKEMPMLWKQAFESTDINNEVYVTLNAQEKIAMDYLQHIRFMDVLEDSEYDLAAARNTYEDVIDDNVQKEIIDLFKENVPKHLKEIQFFQSLVTRQLKPDENPRLLATVQDIQNLLSKYAPQKLLNMSTLTKSVPRFERVKMMMQPQRSRTTTTFQTPLLLPMNKDQKERNAIVKYLKPYLYQFKIENEKGNHPFNFTRKRIIEKNITNIGKQYSNKLIGKSFNEQSRIIGEHAKVKKQLERLKQINSTA